MTEEPQVEETMGGDAMGGDATSDEKTTERSIADELARLGQQLAAAARTAWESDERKRLQNEITNGVQRFGQEISAAASKAVESDQAKEIKTRATRVAEDVQKTDVIEEVRKGLLVGLEAINRELGKMLERMEPKAGEAEVAAPGADVADDEPAVVPDEGTPIA